MTELIVKIEAFHAWLIPSKPHRKNERLETRYLGCNLTLWYSLIRGEVPFSWHLMAIICSCICATAPTMPITLNPGYADYKCCSLFKYQAGKTETNKITHAKTALHETPRLILYCSLRTVFPFSSSNIYT